MGIKELENFSNLIEPPIYRSLKTIDLDGIVATDREFKTQYARTPNLLRLSKKHWESLSKLLFTQTYVFPKSKQILYIGSIFGMRVEVKPYLKKAWVIYENN